MDRATRFSGTHVLQTLYRVNGSALNRVCLAAELAHHKVGLSEALVKRDSDHEQAEASFHRQLTTKGFYMNKNANILLVHGAWADGSCWSKVLLLLKAKRLQRHRGADPADIAR